MTILSDFSLIDPDTTDTGIIVASGDTLQYTYSDGDGDASDILNLGVIFTETTSGVEYIDLDIDGDGSGSFEIDAGFAAGSTWEVEPSIIVTGTDLTQYVYRADGTILGFDDSVVGTHDIDFSALVFSVEGVAPPPPPPDPQVAGDAWILDLGGTLLALVHDENGYGDGTIDYVWSRDGKEMTKVSGDIYELGKKDAGSTITVTVIYTDDLGAAESPEASIDIPGDTGGGGPGGGGGGGGGGGRGKPAKTLAADTLLFAVEPGGSDGEDPLALFPEPARQAERADMALLDVIDRLDGPDGLLPEAADLPFV